MIRINRNNIDKFKYFSCSYHYNIDKGLWLSFDKHTLEYIGVDCFYLVDINKINPLADKLIERLISIDYLEVF